MKLLMNLIVFLAFHGICQGITNNKFKYEEFCYEDYGVNIQEFIRVRSSEDCAFLCEQTGPSCLSYSYRPNTSLCQLKDTTKSNLTAEGCAKTMIATYGEPTTDDPLRGPNVPKCMGGHPCTTTVQGYRLCDGGGPGICHPLQGRVEVLYNEVWGTICDDSFDYSQYYGGTVTCKMLGYSDGVVHCCAHFQQGVGPIHLDDVQCDSPDIKKLEECDHSPWGDHNCGHSEDASVTCYN